MCQGIHIRITLAGIIQIGTIIGNRLIILTLAIIRFPTPEISVVTRFQIISAQRDRTAEKIDRLIQFHIRERLRSQLE